MTKLKIQIHLYFYLGRSVPEIEQELLEFRGFLSAALFFQFLRKVLNLFRSAFDGVPFFLNFVSKADNGLVEKLRGLLEFISRPELHKNRQIAGPHFLKRPFKSIDGAGDQMGE